MLKFVTQYTTNRSVQSVQWVFRHVLIQHLKITAFFALLQYDFRLII
jgi:hypothetical protein